MSTRPAPRMPAAGVDLLPAEGLAEHDVHQVTSLLGRLVDGGAALGWVTAPTTAEIGELVERLAAGTETGESAAAIGLYESLGFTRYGWLPGFVAVGQERFDTLLYSLDLRR